MTTTNTIGSSTPPAAAAARDLPKVNASAGNKKRHFGEASHRKLFDHFTLTMDQETAKYMPYSSVAFPKLNSADPILQQNNELENLWLVGFLDHERETEKKTKMKQLAHFMELPGGAMMPGAATELRRLHHKERQRVSTAERRAEDLTPGQARRVLGQSATAPRLSDALMLRLRELATTKGAGFGATDNARAKAGRSSRAAKARRLRRSKSSPFVVYERENAKLRRTIRERRPARHLAAVKSMAMENLYELEREQTEAAVTIQGCYRRYVNLCMWQTFLLKTRAATLIQRYARGMVARAIVLRWHMRRSWLVIVAQSIVRGLLSRKHWGERCSVERRAAIKCQSTIRSHLSRVLARFLREMRAALMIQRLWRGACGRTIADRLWLDGELTKMQALARGHLGRNAFSELHATMLRAAVNIQRYTRGMRVRQRRSLMLWEREPVQRPAPPAANVAVRALTPHMRRNERRRDFLKILRAEDEYHIELLERMKKRLTRRQLEQKIKEAKKRLKEMREEVRRLEWDYISLKNERAQVSPRAVAQGWTDQLDTNTTEHRKWVTNAKLETIFTTAVYLRQRELVCSCVPYHRTPRGTQASAHGARRIDSERALQEIDDVNWDLAALKERRKAELEALWQRESERKWRSEHKRQVMRVADQKRRWRMQWYTDEGKPDKRRRPGHPWHPEVFAGPERQTFFVGGLELLAAGKELPPRMGTEGGLELIQQQVALQNARNQMQQYSALLRPVFEGVAESMLDVQLRGYPPRKPQPIYPAGHTLGYDATDAGAQAGEVLGLRPITPPELAPPPKGRKEFTSQIPWGLLDDLEAEKTRLKETGTMDAPKYSQEQQQQLAATEAKVKIKLKAAKKAKAKRGLG